MKINDESTQQLFSHFDQAKGCEFHYIYGCIQASVLKSIFLGHLASFANKFFLLGFTKSSLIMIRVSLTGKFQDPKIMLYSDFKRVKTSGWMFGIGKKINIELNDGKKIKLKINKRVGGLKKQKENLIAVCDMLSTINCNF